MVEWIVVCEARGDFTVLTGLVDRVAAAELHWTDGILDSLRRWRGLEADREFTAWKDLKGLASARGLRVYSSGLRTQGPDGGALAGAEALRVDAARRAAVPEAGADDARPRQAHRPIAVV